VPPFVASGISRITSRYSTVLLSTTLPGCLGKPLYQDHRFAVSDPLSAPWTDLVTDCRMQFPAPPTPDQKTFIQKGLRLGTFHVTLDWPLHFHCVSPHSHVAQTYNDVPIRRSIQLSIDRMRSSPAFLLPQYSRSFRFSSPQTNHNAPCSDAICFLSQHLDLQTAGCSWAQPSNLYRLLFTIES